MTEEAKRNYERMFPGKEPSLAKTDPEYFEIVANFALDEVPARNRLAEPVRMKAILAVLLGCQGTKLYRSVLEGALNLGVTPVEVKEILYQGTAYLGLGRVFSFIRITNEVLEAGGISLPLADQGTVEAGNRQKAGNQKQVDYFGEGMRNSWERAPQETAHIQTWLADNCFGDYYTRNGLTDAEREMITFCFLLAQGGCEPQLTAHAAGNLNLGNDREFLIEVVSQCVPYIGYPRSLNALACIDKAAAQRKA